MSSAPRLLHFRLSHYNEKVRWALDHKRWAHVRQALVPGFHLLSTRWLTGQNKVPILVIDGKAMAGSNHILVEIERLRPAPPLYPSDPAERQRALAIETYYSEEVAPDLRRLFWSTYLGNSAAVARLATDGFSAGVRVFWRLCLPLLRPLLRRNMGIDAAAIRGARERLPKHFDRLASEVGPSGYLVGDRFSIADLAAAAVMTAIVRPPEFSYPIPEPWTQEFADVRGSVEDRPGFRWVLETYARHRGRSSEISDP